MLNAASLVRSGKPDADSLAETPADGVVAALAQPPGDAGIATALALLAGIHRLDAATPALAAMLGSDDSAGTAAGWALSQLDAEAATLAAITAGGVDARTNGYYSLAIRAALGRASTNLAAALVARVADENTRARAKKTGLGEHVCRALAVLGYPGTAELIQQVQEADPFTDKFELQRLRKELSNGGRDRESLHQFSQPWAILFADHLAPIAVAEVVAKPAPAPAKAPTAKAPAAMAPPRPAPPAAPPAPAANDDQDAEAPPIDSEAAAATPIDWDAFATSPEAATLTPQVQTLAKQLGPLLEQLAARAIGAPLVDLGGQEIAALLLQVLPQALPPQHVQMALSPQAINAYQAITKYLSRSGLAAAGDDLIAGIKLVRQQLQAQMRKTGMLGGPDYSDPDDTPAKI